MSALETLLQNRWILKSKNKEQYYRLRDEIDEIRKFATEKMGCQIIENQLLVKMEKIPTKAESFMGIEVFQSKMEYVFFCIILMFLEDKEVEEQFVLSQLTEYIQGTVAEFPQMEEGVEWTVYSTRCKLIRVLKYTIDQGILIITDGNEDGFREDGAGEVLYENTGVSRYFMRNFQRDVMEYQSLEDFYEGDWINMDQDRGMIRRHRVYKRILFSPGMYRQNGSEEDFEYLKYYGRRLCEDMEQQFQGQVHIHRGSAYYLAGEDCRMGMTFPGSGVMSNILLLFCKEVQKKVKDKQWEIRQDETIHIDQLELERLIRDLKHRYQDGFGKDMRTMTESKFLQQVLEQLQRWTFLQIDGRNGILYPLCGKICGDYPSDYQQQIDEYKEQDKNES